MRRRLSEEFHYLAEYCRGKELTLKELADHIGPRARALITLIYPFHSFYPFARTVDRVWNFYHD
jgi:hypothetical protein